jgi:hypothetical protein
MFGWVKMLQTGQRHTYLKTQPYSLSLTPVGILAPIQEPQNRNTFHQTGCRIAQKLTPRFQSAVYPDMVLRRHKEVARFRRMMGGLFRNVVGPRAVRIIPVASEGFP